MSSSLALAGRVPTGFYPERRAPHESALERMVVSALGQVWRIHRSRFSRFQAVVPAVERASGTYGSMSDQELSWQARGLRLELRARGLGVESVGKVFALVRELSSRRLRMKHFDVQLIGGWVLLQGMVAEMNAGEGKTLTALFPPRRWRSRAFRSTSSRSTTTSPRGTRPGWAPSTRRSD
jgi:preprotein translocase subunit SecA